jgi:hypothetical protein
MKMGALLALLPSFDTNSLRTEPAKHLAWTLQNYGAYIDDSVGAGSPRYYMINTETGPDGDFTTQFYSDWGFSITDYSAAGTTPSNWTKDLQDIFNNLQVIDNNSAQSVGGGGTPRQPLAPDFAY